MTTLTIAPAERSSASFLSSTLAVARRTLLHFARIPQLLVVSTVQGAMFLLIFRYVFGGAIGSDDGVSYVDFLVPGFVVTGVLFSGMAAAAGVAEDLERGVIDRLRSLPIPRASVAAGRALAETVLVAWGAIVTTAIGFAVGFRPAGTVGESLIALGLCIVFGFAFTWVFIVIGLTAGSAQAAQGMSLLVFPLTFVSSAYVPVDSMPGPLAWFAEHQPVTAMVDAVRAWVGGEPAATSTTWALLWSAALIVVFGPLAVARYRRP